MRSAWLLILICVSMESSAQFPVPKFDVQGHRGARGMQPENSIPAFFAALDSGVTTLEMDLAVTSDQQLIVSHEPWMSASICLDPAGKSFKPSEEKKYNIYQMTAEQVQQFDCGSKGNEKFPEQVRVKAQKPLLREVIIAVEDHIKNVSRYEVDYNIEIKSSKDGDNKFHPDPAAFSDLVYKLLDDYLPLERVVIQSFDFRVLQYWHQNYPEVRLAALIENLKDIDENIRDLGFRPSIYSPHFSLLDKDEIKHLHQLGIRVIPWTVNEPKDMKELKAWGVDGFITDYPNRARQLQYTLKAQPGRK